MIVAPRNDASCVPVWFDSGEIIAVLAITVMTSGGPKFLLWSNKQQSTGLFPVGEFEVVDPRIPNQWVCKTTPAAHIELSPEEWQSDGFWERYHDEEPQAVEVFHRWRKILSGDSAKAFK
jgi:hypothetical protein